MSAVSTPGLQRDAMTSVEKSSIRGLKAIRRSRCSPDAVRLRVGRKAIAAQSRPCCGPASVRTRATWNADEWPQQ
jgi:hypothetical protein